MLATVTARRDLELFVAAAWPAAEARSVDGWLLRSTPGTHGRRLNSALPLSEAVGPPPAGTDLVQVTPLEEHRGLDDALAAAGWAAEAPTEVLTATRIAGTPAGDAMVERVDVRTWRAAWRALGTRERSGGSGEEDVLDRIGFELAPLVAVRDGALAGIALGILGDGVSLVVEVATAPEHRRRGVATALMRAWAELAGDRELVLQVMTGNVAGRALYDRLGFSRSHGYHDRRAPTGTRASGTGTAAR